MPKKIKTKEVDYLGSLPACFFPYLSAIRSATDASILTFNARFNRSLFRLAPTAAMTQASLAQNPSESQTTRVDPATGMPVTLPLDGVPLPGPPNSHRIASESVPMAQPMSLANETPSIQVRFAHVIDEGTRPVVVFTIESSYAGGYYSRVYRTWGHVQALGKLISVPAKLPPVPTGSDAVSPEEWKKGVVKAYLKKLATTPSVRSSRAFLSWLGLNNTLQKTASEKTAEDVFEDMWLTYYASLSPGGFVPLTRPADMMAFALVAELNTIIAKPMLDVGEVAGADGKVFCYKCLLSHALQHTERMWEMWQEQVPAILQKFRLLPEGGRSFNYAFDACKMSMAPRVSESIGPFCSALRGVLRGFLSESIPAIKGVRHTWRKNAPREQKSYHDLLRGRWEGNATEEKFQDLEKRIAFEAKTLQASVEFANKEIQRTIDKLQNAYSKGSLEYQMLPFLRKIPTLNRTFFYLWQPSVPMLFFKHFLQEREKLFSGEPVLLPKHKRPLEPLQAFATRMCEVLPFVERHSAFSIYCVREDLIREVIESSESDVSMPQLPQLQRVIMFLFKIYDEITHNTVRYFQQVVRSFVNAASDLHLSTTSDLQSRAEIIRSCSITAYDTCTDAFKSSLMRKLPDILTELFSLLFSDSAKNAVALDIPLFAAEAEKSTDPTINTFLDISEAAEEQVVDTVRETVLPLVKRLLEKLTARPFNPTMTVEHEEEKHLALTATQSALRGTTPKAGTTPPADVAESLPENFES